MGTITPRAEAESSGEVCEQTLTDGIFQLEPLGYVPLLPGV